MSCEENLATVSFGNCLESLHHLPLIAGVLGSLRLLHGVYDVALLMFLAQAFGLGPEETEKHEPSDPTATLVDRDVILAGERQLENTFPFGVRPELGVELRSKRTVEIRQLRHGTSGHIHGPIPHLVLHRIELVLHLGNSLADGEFEGVLDLGILIR